MANLLLSEVTPAPVEVEFNGITKSLLISGRFTFVSNGDFSVYESESGQRELRIRLSNYIFDKLGVVELKDL